uniref:Uncharacterized protein n=1 Tax=Rhodosorus marinus TaxID=101924 RepID=A0A7S3A132_9RHOD|mmetsp:Transcript_37999/g.150995  ORF Transcript_37999/g.150995 Transcript_37999/m.150995 type:complete len:117 (+) Transcript_37999:534-884(+)
MYWIASYVEKHAMKTITIVTAIHGASLWGGLNMRSFFSVGFEERVVIPRSAPPFKLDRFKPSGRRRAPFSQSARLAVLRKCLAGNVNFLNQPRPQSEWTPLELTSPSLAVVPGQNT